MKKYSVLFTVLAFLTLSIKLFGQVSAEGISPGGILDSQNPEVTVISPNGGEVYQIGDSVDITWTAVDSSFGLIPINLYYSIDNGLNFSLIEDSLSNTGTYRWEIPDEPSLEMLVKVTATDSFGLTGADTSDAVFKIDGPPSPPENLVATLSDHAITLDWDAVNEGDLESYFIYRSTVSGVEAILSNRIDTVLVPNNTFTDTDVEHDSTYYYVVTAVDSMGNESVASGEVSGTAYILQIIAVSFSQRTDGSKNVDITYSFTGNPSGTYTITPYVSTNGGVDWQDCITLSGDYGEGIVPGTDKGITWGFGTDMSNVYSSNVKIKISATEESTPSKRTSNRGQTFGM